MRVCIIGPSHIAALRSAERNGLASLGRHDVTYMGHEVKVFRHLAFRDGRLFFDCPDTRMLAEDLKAEADLADFDALFFHGIGPRLSRLQERLAKNGVDLAAMSSAMRAKALERAFGGEMFQVLRAVRDRFDGPILVSSKPEHAAPADTEVDALDALDLEPLAGIIGTTLHGMGFHYLPQPAETIVKGRFTRPEYAEGSWKTLGESRPGKKVDIWHMNEKYGAVILGKAAELVDAA